MPKVQSESHAAGYVRGRMDQLREIRNRMDAPDHQFSRGEVIEILWQVHRAQLAIQTNIQAAGTTEIRELLCEYIGMAVALHDRAMELMESVGGIAGIDVPPRPELDSELRAPIPQKKKKKKNKGGFDWNNVSWGDDSDTEKSGGPLAEYASDNEQPMSIGAMSAVYATKDTKVVHPEDLRKSINRAQRIREEKMGAGRESSLASSYDWAATNRRKWDAENQHRGNLERRHNHNHDHDHNQPGTSRAALQRDREMADCRSRSTMSVSSRKSTASSSSYVSRPQVPRNRRVTGVLYPPMATRCPVDLNPSDPSLIGRDEYYTTVIPNNGICPLCRGRHKVYRCTMFLRAGLQERWYWALLHGLCLNCLYSKHSSFTCQQDGACPRCGKRHNSLLCPWNPEWHDHGGAA